MAWVKKTIAPKHKLWPFIGFGDHLSGHLGFNNFPQWVQLRTLDLFSEMLCGKQIWGNITDLSLMVIDWATLAATFKLLCSLLDTSGKTLSTLSCRKRVCTGNLTPWSYLNKSIFMAKCDGLNEWNSTNEHTTRTSLYKYDLCTDNKFHLPASHFKIKNHMHYHTT